MEGTAGKVWDGNSVIREAKIIAGMEGKVEQRKKGQEYVKLCKLGAGRRHKTKTK